MKPAIRISDQAWFCVGRIIEANDHPKLTKYISFRQDGSGTKRHLSFSEAVQYCYDNPDLSPEQYAHELGVSYKTPKVKEGIYMGVMWHYSKEYHCYYCDAARFLPFQSLRQLKAYIRVYV